MSGYLPPVHVDVTSVDATPHFLAVDANGSQVGLFLRLGDLVRTIDLDDIVTD